ncbi:MAG TPA: SurA N-terminal domain-containing protein [Polyangiaceae bacterium]
MRLRNVLAAGLVAAFSLAASHSANATIVERVVAVVGERPILLTDLRKRARPFLIHIIATTPNAAQQAAQESDMYRELLNRMIDDRLEEQAADKGHIVATSEEIDRGIRQKAESLNLSLKDLLAAAKQQGLSEQEYRDEIRRQILEGKLIQLRVMSRVRVTDEDARAAYVHWRKETDGEKLTLVNLFVLRIPAGATPNDIAELQATAQKYADQAKRENNFCDLVKQFSSDPKGCQHGLQGVSTLLPALQNLTAPMKEGDISPAEVFTDEQVVVVAQMQKAPHVPTFDEVKPQMKEQAMGEVVERQRKIWLDELRKNVYVDVRL